MLPPEHLLALDSPPSFPCVFWVPERRGRLVSETRFIAEHRWANLDEGADVPQQKPKKMQKGRFSENAKASVPRSEVSGAHNQCNWAVCAVWSHIFLQNLYNGGLQRSFTPKSTRHISTVVAYKKTTLRKSIRQRTVESHQAVLCRVCGSQRKRCDGRTSWRRKTQASTLAVLLCVRSVCPVESCAKQQTGMLAFS